MKALLIAVSAVAVIGGSVAHADALPAAQSYELLPDPLTPGHVSTSPTVTVGAGTTVDDFTFTLASSYETAATGLFFELPGFGYSITSADLSLYSGTPAGPGALIASTGDFNPSTTPETLGADLTSGDYFVQSSVQVPSGDTGAFSIGATVSAAPEPAVWALMICGVAAIGLSFRVRASSRMGLAVAA